MRIIIIVSLAISACNTVPKYSTCDNATFWLAQGVCVDSNGFDIDAASVQAIYDESLNRYLEIYPDDLPAITESIAAMPPEIKFYAELRDGTQLGSHVAKSISLAYRECLGNTALGHELLHQFRGMSGKGSDGSHSDSLIFESGNYYDMYISAENRINKTVCPDMCGESCAWALVYSDACTYDDSCPEGFAPMCGYFPDDSNCWDNL